MLKLRRSPAFVPVSLCTLFTFSLPTFAACRVALEDAERATAVIANRAFTRQELVTKVKALEERITKYGHPYVKSVGGEFWPTPAYFTARQSLLLALRAECQPDPDEFSLQHVFDSRSYVRHLISRFPGDPSKVRAIDFLVLLAMQGLEIESPTGERTIDDLVVLMMREIVAWRSEFLDLWIIEVLEENPGFFQGTPRRVAAPVPALLPDTAELPVLPRGSVPGPAGPDARRRSANPRDVPIGAGRIVAASLLSMLAVAGVWITLDYPRWQRAAEDAETVPAAVTPAEGRPPREPVGGAPGENVRQLIPNPRAVQVLGSGVPYPAAIITRDEVRFVTRLPWEVKKKVTLRKGTTVTAVSPSGRLIAASDGKEVIVIDSFDGRQVSQLNKAKSVSQLHFKDDESLISIGETRVPSGLGRIDTGLVEVRYQEWNPAKGIATHGFNLPAKDSDPTAFTNIPSIDRMLMGTNSGVIKLMGRDAFTHQEFGAGTHGGQMARAIRISQDGKQFLVLLGDGRVVTHSLRDPLEPFSTFDRFSAASFFDAAGKQILVASGNEVKIVTRSGEVIKRFRDNLEAGDAWKWVEPLGTEAVFALSRGGSVQVWKLNP